MKKLYMLLLSIGAIQGGIPLYGVTITELSSQARLAQNTTSRTASSMNMSEDDTEFFDAQDSFDTPQASEQQSTQPTVATENTSLPVYDTGRGEDAEVFEDAVEYETTSPCSEASFSVNMPSETVTHYEQPSRWARLTSGFLTGAWHCWNIVRAYGRYVASDVSNGAREAHNIARAAAALNVEETGRRIRDAVVDTVVLQPVQASIYDRLLTTARRVYESPVTRNVAAATAAAALAYGAYRWLGDTNEAVSENTQSTPVRSPRFPIPIGSTMHHGVKSGISAMKFKSPAYMVPFYKWVRESRAWVSSAKK